MNDREEALEFLARQEVKPQIVERGLRDVSQALEEIENGKVQGRIVIKLE